MSSKLGEHIAANANLILECAKLRNEVTRKKEAIWCLEDKIRQLEADVKELRITRAGLQAKLGGVFV